MSGGIEEPLCQGNNTPLNATLSVEGDYNQMINSVTRHESGSDKITRLDCDAEGRFNVELTHEQVELDLPSTQCLDLNPGAAQLDTVPAGRPFTQGNFRPLIVSSILLLLALPNWIGVENVDEQGHTKHPGLLYGLYPALPFMGLFGVWLWVFLSFHPNCLCEWLRNRYEYVLEAEAEDAESADVSFGRRALQLLHMTKATSLSGDFQSVHLVLYLTAYISFVIGCLIANVEHPAKNQQRFKWCYEQTQNLYNQSVPDNDTFYDDCIDKLKPFTMQPLGYWLYSCTTLATFSMINTGLHLAENCKKLEAHWGGRNRIRATIANHRASAQRACTKSTAVSTWVNQQVVRDLHKERSDDEGKTTRLYKLGMSRGWATCAKITVVVALGFAAVVIQSADSVKGKQDPADDHWEPRARTPREFFASLVFIIGLFCVFTLVVQVSEMLAAPFRVSVWRQNYLLKTLQNWEQNKAEKRVDACDGQVYTKEEFTRRYGGTAEWDAATMAGKAHQPGLTSIVRLEAWWHARRYIHTARIEPEYRAAAGFVAVLLLAAFLLSVIVGARFFVQDKIEPAIVFAMLLSGLIAMLCFMRATQSYLAGQSHVKCLQAIKLRWKGFDVYTGMEEGMPDEVREALPLYAETAASNPGNGKATKAMLLYLDEMITSIEKRDQKPSILGIECTPTNLLLLKTYVSMFGSAVYAKLMIHGSLHSG